MPVKLKGACSCGKTAPFFATINRGLSGKVMALARCPFCSRKVEEIQPEGVHDNTMLLFLENQWLQPAEKTGVCHRR